MVQVKLRESSSEVQKLYAKQQERLEENQETIRLAKLREADLLRYGLIEGLLALCLGSC